MPQALVDLIETPVGKVQSYARAYLDLVKQHTEMYSWWPEDKYNRDAGVDQSFVQLCHKVLRPGMDEALLAKSEEVRCGFVDYSIIFGAVLVLDLCSFCARYAKFRKGDLQFAKDLLHPTMHSMNSMLNEPMDLEDIIAQAYEQSRG
jgi:hypothetical protein